MIKVHETAVIHPRAGIAEGVEIGEYSVIGEKVRIGPGTRIYPHVIIQGDVVIGKENQIFPGVVIGMPPQDLKWDRNETRICIGDRNLIREYVTIHMASQGGTTRIGNDNFLMAYTHVAHNCEIGHEVIITNATSLAGYVAVEDKVVIGGMAGIHQFVRVGTMAMVGGFSKNVKDIPPYMKADGQPARVVAVNTLGLRRHGVPAERREAIKKAYKLLYRSQLNLTQALDRIEAEVPPFQEVTYLLEFMKNSSRMGVLI